MEIRKFIYELPMAPIPLPAICFMLVIVLPPAFSQACAASFRILHKICFIGSLWSIATEWAAGISAGLFKPFIAGSAAPCVISVYLEDCLLPTFRALGIGMPAYLFPLKLIFTKSQIVFSALHITLPFLPVQYPCNACRCAPENIFKVVSRIQLKRCVYAFLYIKSGDLLRALLYRPHIRIPSPAFPVAQG